MWARGAKDSLRRCAQTLTATRNDSSMRYNMGGCISGAAALKAQGSPWRFVTPDCIRSLQCNAPTFAKQDDVDGVNQELADFFGTKHQQKPDAPSPLAPRLAAEASCDDVSQGGQPEVKSDAETFAYQPNEPHPSAKSASLRHPKACQTGSLSHIDKDGRASMVDVSRFVNTQREAIASVKVVLGSDVYHLVSANGIKKGDVLTVAQLAGIMGAKQCSTLVPLCHNILISYVDVKLRLDKSDHSVNITAEAHTHGPTGVEMEALTAASTAALTVFDMCKAVSRQLVIQDLRLERKTGGKSGTFDRKAGIGF